MTLLAVQKPREEAQWVQTQGRTSMHAPVKPRPIKVRDTATKSTELSLILPTVPHFHSHIIHRTALVDY